MTFRGQRQGLAASWLGRSTVTRGSPTTDPRFDPPAATQSQGRGIFPPPGAHHHDQGGGAQRCRGPVGTDQSETRIMAAGGGRFPRLWPLGSPDVRPSLHLWAAAPAPPQGDGHPEMPALAA